MTSPKLSGSYFKLLTPGNPKTIKGVKKGYWTFILHLAPTDLSGFQVCPMATAGCKAACLNTAGRGGIAAGGILTEAMIREGTRTNAVQEARKRRTVRFFKDRAAFMADLIADIKKAVAFCEKHGFVPVFRLNGTSDIRWERVPVMMIGPGAGWAGSYLNIMDSFPDVQFYDYTKLRNRRNLPSNYHVTFSLADGNHEAAKVAYASGMNVAVVFRDKATVARYVETGFWTGEEFSPVFVGDESDLRFTDPRGICALYAKGNAKKDKSGFVRD